MKAAADTFIGSINKGTAEYALAYRHIEHASLKSVCQSCKHPSLTLGAQTIQFGPDLRAFAAAVVNLQDRRHQADYDPALYLYVSDVRSAVATARDAVRSFRTLPSDQRLKFLFLLMAKPKGRP